MHAHLEALKAIQTNNRLKAEAAMNEDFESAIVYKKRITELESVLLAEPDFSQQFWSNKPSLTHEELLLRLVDLDASFAKNLLAKSPSKTRTASLLIVL